MCYGIFWVVNSMPHFSEKPRRVIRLAEINPYLRAERRRVSSRANDAAFDAAWNSAEETH
jgi:hypothetical protein